MKLVDNLLIVPGTNLGACLFGPFPVGTVIRSMMVNTVSLTTTEGFGLQVFSLSGPVWSASPMSEPSSGRRLFPAATPLDSSQPSFGLGVTVSPHPFDIPLNLLVRDDRYLLVHMGESMTGGRVTVVVHCDAPPQEI